MGSFSERELIDQAATGDYRAFRTLVETFQGFVYSIAFRFTRDEAESEDLTQETFIRLWKNLDRYNAEFKLKTWLGKIVTNLALDHLKSGRKKNEKMRLALHDELNVQSHEQPEALWNAHELQQLVLKLSEQLTPKQRAVFVLRDLEQLAVDEVCVILEMSAGNVKSNLYYARLCMKTEIEKYYKMGVL
jgi:RNA polymerase sigma-70 factor (ECF subfamily)